MTKGYEEEEQDDEGEGEMRGDYKGHSDSNIHIDVLVHARLGR